jgi:NADH-ubiquinone oxidoreductase chain 5
LGANFEYDSRKVIALSTLSQLGLIIGAVSAGLVDLAFFHLLTHALFKALLFICAHIIIHTIRDSQYVRFMGNLSFQILFTSVCLTFNRQTLETIVARAGRSLFKCPLLLCQFLLERFQ